MWDLTGDEALLEEAAQEFPNDPGVCVAMIGHHGGTTAKGLPWIERLLAVEPSNPHVWHIKAWALRASLHLLPDLSLLPLSPTA